MAISAVSIASGISMRSSEIWAIGFIGNRYSANTMAAAMKNQLKVLE
jgi:hypothetical protein